MPASPSGLDRRYGGRCPVTFTAEGVCGAWYAMLCYRSVYFFLMIMILLVLPGGTKSTKSRLPRPPGSLPPTPPLSWFHTHVPPASLAHFTPEGGTKTKTTGIPTTTTTTPTLVSHLRTPPPLAHFTPDSSPLLPLSRPNETP